MTTLTEPEILDADSILSPLEREVVHEMALAVHADLNASAQMSAAWLEISAWFLATLIQGARQSPDPEPTIAKLKEYVGIRAEAILSPPSHANKDRA